MTDKDDIKSFRYFAGGIVFIILNKSRLPPGGVTARRTGDKAGKRYAPVRRDFAVEPDIEAVAKDFLQNPISPVRGREAVTMYHENPLSFFRELMEVAVNDNAGFTTEEFAQPEIMIAAYIMDFFPLFDQRRQLEDNF